MSFRNQFEGGVYRNQVVALHFAHQRALEELEHTQIERDLALQKCEELQAQLRGSRLHDLQHVLFTKLDYLLQMALMLCMLTACAIPALVSGVHALTRQVSSPTHVQSASASNAVSRLPIMREHRCLSHNSLERLEVSREISWLGKYGLLPFNPRPQREPNSNRNVWPADQAKHEWTSHAPEELSSPPLVILL